MKGIYKIFNKVSKKSYIGSSMHIDERWKQHTAQLKKGLHANDHLQNVWNKYGEDKFESSVLKETKPWGNLLKDEQSFIDKDGDKNVHEKKNFKDMIIGLVANIIIKIGKEVIYPVILGIIKNKLGKK